jgi:polyphenol oxidase
MPFHQTASIRYYSFENLDDSGVLNAAFTRNGGLSPTPWASLNVGGLRGDEPGRVYGNRVLAFQAVGRAPESVYDVWQVHGNNVICTESPRPFDVPHKKADAIFTDCPEVTLFMRFADCVPILLYDPVRKVIGLVHAGWQGTVNGTVTEALDVMSAHYGSKTIDVQAAIGPSICLDHYPVGNEVFQKVRAAFGDVASKILHIRNGKYHFNLWEANRLRLEQKGIRDINIAKICTACHLDDWYSHRGEAGRTGRFGVLMALTK